MSNFFGNLRTDLAAELTKSKVTKLNEHVSRTDVTVDEEAAKRLNKPVGNYTTIMSSVIARGEPDWYPRLKNALTACLKEYVGDYETCLVVGLGNPNMTADALGAMVTERVHVTRGLVGDSGGVATLAPNVLGVTGVESYDVIKGVVERVKPDIILAVDSLCAASSERLATAFQITDGGIAPGSGVSNYRFSLDKNSMHCRVVSIGVPLVVYASTIAREAGADTDSELIVTPKDVDLIALECAEVISGAINAALS